MSLPRFAPASVLSIRLFGDFEADLNGSAAIVTNERARTLLALLALSGGRANRGRVLRALWPDVDERAARRRLSETLSRLRQAGDLGPLLSAEGETIILAAPPATLTVDAQVFAESVRGARAAVGVEQEALLERALSLYRAPLLPNNYAAWCLEERDALDELYLEALTTLSDRYRQTGRLEEALELARRATRLKPLAERGHRQVMMCLAVLGRRTEALACFRELREALTAELEVEPELDTRALARVIRRSDRTPVMPMNPGRLPLIGRDEELARLNHGLEMAARGITNAVTLEGASGLGKSRLLEALMVSARWRGMTVLRADAERVGERPFGVIAKLILDASTSELERIRRLVPAHWRAAAAEAVPALRASWTDIAPPLALEDAHRRMIEALRQVLDALATLSPLTLTVDNVHLCDRASLEVLADRNTRPGGVLLVLAMRPQAARTSGTLSALQALTRGPLERITLAPLAVAAVDTMVSGALGRHDSSLARALVERTGGNPLFLVECLRELRSPAILKTSTGGLQALIENRLDTLTSDERSALEAAAVLGSGWTPAALATVGELKSARVSSDALHNSGWLTAHREGDLTMSHGLVAEVIYERIEPGKRAAMHRRALTILQADPSGHTRHSAVARHARALGDHSAEASAAVAAGEASLASGAFDDAQRDFDCAVDALATSEDDALRFRALSGRGEVQRLLGRAEVEPELEAIAARLGNQSLIWKARLQNIRARMDSGESAEAHTLGEALADEASASGDAEVGWRAARLAAQALAYDSHYLEATTRLQALLVAAPTLADRARLTNELATALTRTGRYAEALETARRAQSLARDAGLVEVEVGAIHTEGSIHSEQQRYDEAHAAYRVALTRAVAAGYLYGELQARVNEANLSAFQSRHEEALLAYQDALPSARAHGNPHATCLVLSNTAATLQHLGRVEEAIAAYQDAMTSLSALSVETLTGPPSIHQGLAGCHLALKDYEAALEHGERAVAGARKSGDTYVLVHSLNVLGDVQRLRGMLVASRDVLEEALSLCRDTGMKLVLEHCQVGLAATLQEQGETDAAVALLRSLSGSDNVWVHDRRVEVLLAAKHPDLLPALEVGRETLITALRAIDDPTNQQDFLVHHQQLALAISRHLGPLPDDLPRLPWQQTAQLSPVEVIWTPSLPDDMDDAAGRRARLQRLLDEATTQGAEPTNAQLAEALGVSRRTVIRDRKTLTGS